MKVPFFLLVAISGLMLFCSSPPKAEKKRDPKESYAQKYKTVDGFIKWIEEGESGKSTGKKLKKKKSEIVKAIEGAEVEIDGKKQECYVYDTEQNWKYFETYVKEIGSGFEITNYYNVRCVGVETFK